MRSNLFTLILIVTLALTGCAHFMERSPAADNVKQICNHLKQQMSLGNNSSINYPNRTPTQQAMLYRQYAKYQCDDVLTDHQ